jgi:signal recognition particle subunit SRP54
MFETLTGRIDQLLRQLSGVGKITEKNVQDALREIRMIFLEADVNYKVAKNFIERVKEKALGKAVLDSVTPAQHMTKIIYDAMVELLGSSASDLVVRNDCMNVIMLAGLQGSGKTTTIVKLALYLKKKGHRPLLVAGDVSRPAAIDQLIINGKKIDVPVYAEPAERNVPAICRRAVQEAGQKGYNVVLVDTAGRLHIDESMMRELQEVKQAINPTETLLVVDGMSGQDALTVAQSFLSQINYDGFIMTKLDGDSRGGAALSIREVTAKPIKFISVGEDFGQFEKFHPERIASRILGKGDIVSLVERAQDSMDLAAAQKMEQKIKTSRFTLEDFLQQMQQLKKMGPLSSLLEMMPGMGGKAAQALGDNSEASLTRVEAIICSMTKRERENPDLIDGSRRRRIAAGSGTSIQEINQLLKQFNNIEKLIKMFGKGGHRKAGLPLPFQN